MRRNHLAKDDLDWLPPSYRLLRGAIVSGVWTTLFGSAIWLLWHGPGIFIFGKFFVVLGAAGYWVGDRASKGLVSLRLGKLARGQVDLAKLSNQEDGDLVHVRGRVRAERTVPAVLSDDQGVYRRTRVKFGELDIVDEEAVDFHLVDDEGHAIAIEVEGARLLVNDPKLTPTASAERLRALTPATLLDGQGRTRWSPANVTAAETLLRPGDEVEAVGYKSRKVDATVVDRLARETPMRAALRAGKELPLILSVVNGERR